MTVVDQSDGAGDIASRSIALHARGREKHMDSLRSTGDHVDDVAYCGPGRRRDHTNTTRKYRQRALQLFGEQPFGTQAVAQLFKGQLQRAGADGIQTLDDKFVFAAWLVHGQTAARAHVQAVGWSKTYARVG